MTTDVPHLCAFTFCGSTGVTKIIGDVRLPGQPKPVTVETWVCSTHGKTLFGSMGPFSIEGRNRG